MSIIIFLFYLFSSSDSHLFEKGVDFYQNQNYEQALNIFSTLSEKHPRNITMSQNQAICYLKLQKPLEALVVLKKALYSNPFNSQTKKLYELAKKELTPFHNPSLGLLFMLKLYTPWFALFLLLSSFLYLFVWCFIEKKSQSLKVFSFVFLLLSCFLLVQKIQFETSSYGTSLKSQHAFLTPNQSSSKLFAIEKAQSLEITGAFEGFTQVKNHLGEKGWILNNNLKAHWGKND